MCIRDRGTKQPCRFKFWFWCVWPTITAPAINPIDTHLFAIWSSFASIHSGCVSRCLSALCMCFFIILTKWCGEKLFSTLFWYLSHSFCGYKCIIVNVMISLGYGIYLSFVNKLWFVVSIISIENRISHPYSLDGVRCLSKSAHDNWVDPHTTYFIRQRDRRQCRTVTFLKK